MRILKRKNILHNRTRLLLVVFFIMSAILIARLFQLQILKHDYYTKAALGQHQLDKVLLQSRGEVFIHDFRNQGLAPLILNRKLYLVYAVPSEITNPRNTAEVLAAILEPDQEQYQLLEDQIFEQVKKEQDPYEPIQHKLTENQMEQIRTKNLAGIYFEDEWERYYPEADSASHITGFWGYHDDSRAGQYGIEGYFDDILAGQAGRVSGAKDIYGRLIPIADQELIEQQNGPDIVLTLDKIIQTKAHEIIKQAVEKYAADNGVLIVMEPGTGHIKAMAGFPGYDPNNYTKVESIDVFRNLAVADAYEPGSIFKIITMAAGLDSGSVQVDDTFFDDGFVQFGNDIIRNASNKSYGQLTMAGILENSVNTGAVYIALRTGKKVFRDYALDFGFGREMSIGFFGQVKGDVSSLDNDGDIYLATAAYGQGITVTPLQMATAMSTIVNNGRLVVPRLVDYIQKPNGDQININPSEPKQVISPDTSMLLKAMLVSVVKNGQGSGASIPGYYIGGKTGTAEIAKAGGYSNETNHSFVGFGPMDDPCFVIMVKLSRPKFGGFSASTAAPTFANMASFLLQYYQIPPEY